MGVICQLGKVRGDRLYRLLHHAVRIGQAKLHALDQRCLQSFVGLRTAMRHHHGAKVLPQRLAGRHLGVKAPPHQGARRAVVFEQLVVHGQAQALQHRHRGRAQQGGKPAVKRTNLHRTPTGQHRAVQIGQLLALVRAGLRVGRYGHTAHAQFGLQRGVVGAGEFEQPLVEALAHLAGGFFGEGNGQNLVRAHAAAGRIGGLGRITR